MTDFQFHVYRLLELQTDSDRERYILRHPELATAESARMLCRSAVAEGAKAEGRARPLCETLDLVARLNPGPLVRAYSAHAWAAVHYREGVDHGRAVHFWKMAHDQFLAAGKHDEAAITCYCGLASLDIAGEMDLFWQWEAEAKAYFESTGDHLRLARLRSNVAGMYIRQANWSRAAQLFEATFHELPKLNAGPADVNLTLEGLSVCYQNLGDLPRAVQFLEKARQLCEDAQFTYFLIGILQRLASAKYLQGEFSASLSLLRQRRDYLGNRSESLWDYEAALLEADVLRSLGLPVQAERIARAALNGYRRLGLPLEQGAALLAVGRCLEMLGRPRTSLALYKEARELFDVYPSVVGQRLSDMESASALYATGRFDLSYQLTTSLLVAEEELTPEQRIRCRLLLTRLLLERRQVAEARAILEGAMSRVLLLNHAALEADALLQLALIYERSALHQAAYDTLLRCERFVNRVRGNVTPGDLRISFFSDKTDLYENLFSLGTHLQHTPEELWSLAERSKSRTLAEQLAIDVSPASPHSADDDRTRRLQTILDNLRATRKVVDRMATDSSAPRVDELSRRVSATEEAARRMLRDQGGQLHSTIPEQPRLQDVVAYIPQDTVLVEFYIARGTIHAFVIAQGEVRCLPLADARQAERLCRLALFQFRPRYFVKSPPVTTDAAHYLWELHRTLWAPLHLPASTARIIVVPHGFLHRLPFHALFDGEDFLVARHAFAYSPSAAVFCTTRRRPKRSARESLVIGAVDGRAPAIAAEVQLVASALPSAKIMLGHTDFNDLERELATARFVHIAAHGRFEQTSPRSSSLILGNAALTVQDMQRLELSADLVVLSGCDTGRSAKGKSDELIGWANAVLQAGAHSALVSLWPVDDLSTSRFMSRFYTLLADHTARDVSLQQAMIAHRLDYPHPFYWAPFVLVGNPEP